MKTLFSDPLYWSKTWVGSPLRFGLALSIHLIYCLVIGGIIYEEGMSYLLAGLILIGVAMPFMYLYALRKLVILIESGETKSNS
jgi:hypothetical protein